MKIKRAGVYDRWLNSLGGGEQVAFAYATALRDLGYKTELVTHGRFDIRAAEEKMNINLKNIGVKYIPFLADSQLSGYTEDYDIFVCNSYLDYIPNRSKYGILSIFFPSRVDTSLYEYLKRKVIVPSLRNFFIYPSRFEGFRYDEVHQRRIHKYLGENSTIVFSVDIKEVQLQIHFEYLAFSCLDNIKFSFNSKPVKYSQRVVSIQDNFVYYIFKFGDHTKGKRLTINLPQSEYSDKISLVKIIIPSFRYALYNAFKDLFPRFEMRLHGGASLTKFSDIESYDQILSISDFSKKWVNLYWGMESKVLYPPVSTKFFYPAKEKRNIIAHIGRFFVGGHSKKQLEMVRVFKQLVDDGFGNWELHFIGSVAEGNIHQQYLEQVKNEALGYPVHFHVNAPFVELRDILSQAKIYWHATGLDENPEKNPIRLEHFGITTVEAMASGCVPVVIDLGGQSEIVGDDCGFKWNTKDELRNFTERLIQEPNLLRQMSERSIERSKVFSIQNFKKELKKYLP